VTGPSGSGKQRAPQEKGRSEEPGPAEGLLEQRETFIQTFFKKGAELTEELLREDQRLRTRLRDVEAENAALRAQVASEDAIRDLLLKIRELEREKKDLLSRMHDVQASTNHYNQRFADIEAENAQLASLYVASHQLHSTLDLRSIVRQLKELLAQFVGARAFAVYLSDDDRKELVPFCSEGVNASALKRMPIDRNTVLGRAVETGNAEWVEGDATNGTIESPAATIPMLLHGRAIGVIAVFATFEQKPSFVDVDFELFKLLGAHAASALVASRLFAEHGARVGPVDSYLDLE
jgi:hypothetical protein